MTSYLLKTQRKTLERVQGMKSFVLKEVQSVDFYVEGFGTDPHKYKCHTQRIVLFHCLSDQASLSGHRSITLNYYDVVNECFLVKDHNVAKE